MPLRAPTRGLRLWFLMAEALAVIVCTFIFIAKFVYFLTVLLPWVCYTTGRDLILIICIEHAIEDREYLSRKIHALLGKMKDPPAELLIHDDLAPLPQFQTRPQKKQSRKRTRNRKPKRKMSLLKYTGDAQDGASTSPALPLLKPGPPAVDSPSESA